MFIQQTIPIDFFFLSKYKMQMKWTFYKHHKLFEVISKKRNKYKHK